MSQAPYEAEYQQYLARVQAHLGSLEEGAYGKFGGRLVQRLSYTDFSGKWEHYSELKNMYDQSLARGDTVNDAIVQMVDENAAELLIPSVLSVQFKTGDSL